MMKRIWNLMAAALCVMLVCCSSDDNVEPAGNVRVSPTALTAAAGGGEVTLTVEADCEWGIYAADSWVKCKPTGGMKGTTEVTLTVAANPSQREDRATEITVKAGAARVNVPLTQRMLVEELAVADANLKRCLVDGYDADGDGIFSVVEAAALTELNISGKGVAAFAELGAFPALVSLDCSDNALEKLDLSGLEKLRTLDCSKNRLTVLNIRNNRALETLDCTENPLTRIEVWSGFEAPAGFKVPETAEYILPDMYVPEGYTLFWSDEFDGAALDTKCWTAEIGNGAGGWGNAELQYYTAREKNVAVKEGTLRITAVKENYEGFPVTSARLITLKKVFFKYGYVVASIKLPKTADGLWPAFWMMGNDFSEVGWPKCGETDILEMGNSAGIKAGTQERYLNGACHWGQSYANHVTYDYSVQDGEFHTFTCIWDENYVRMYIDLETHPGAKPYFEMKITGELGNNVFRKDNFLLLNLAVGGQFPGIFDINGVTALKNGPATMEVDYVRVFQKK